MKNIFEGIQGVLFDLDGTLVDTNIDFSLMKREMIALGAHCGISADNLANLDILSIVDYVVGHLEKRGKGKEAVEARQEAMQRLEIIELANCQDAKPVEGAVNLLAELQSIGFKFGIVTRNCRAAVELSMEIAGIRSHILLTRDDVPHPKPSPDHLFRALDMMSISAKNAVMIGDHWMDIQAGRRAEMRTVGFLRSDRPTDFFDREPPDLVIECLSELLIQIKRLKK